MTILAKTILLENFLTKYDIARKLVVSRSTECKLKYLYFNSFFCNYRWRVDYEKKHRVAEVAGDSTEMFISTH